MPRKATYSTPVDQETIGRRLRETRKRRGLTQAELAEKLDMKQALVSDYERGKLRLHGGLIIAFAKVLHVTTDELLGLRATPRDPFFTDRSVVRRMKLIEALPRRKKQAVLSTLDSFLKGVGVSS